MEEIAVWSLVIGLLCGIVMGVRFGALPAVLFFTILVVIQQLAGVR